MWRFWSGDVAGPLLPQKRQKSIGACSMTLTLESPLVNIPLQGLPIAAAALDRNRVIVAANPLFGRLCGQADTTCSGQRLEDIVAEPDRPTVEEALNILRLLDDRAPQTCSIQALRAKPPSLWLAIDVTRLGPDSIVPYVACLQAISRRRRLDRPPNRRLRARIEKSPETCLDSAARSVIRGVEPWPPFLMTLSHELRGPLTAIRGWVQMAEKGALAPEKMSEALTVIGRNAASLSDLIESLFDLSRCAAGSLALKRRVLDLNPLAHLVAESTLPVARYRDVSLTVGRARAPLLVNGDPPRLEQVVRNLVENALKFTPAGGHVHVHTGCDGSFAELVVSDNGLGISRDLLPVIFEPFRHDDATVPPAERGLGLGLALVRELVQLHQGEIRALSGGKGQGSTFIVRLPLVISAVPV
jgi:two-component sensor histidine kinase